MVEEWPFFLHVSGFAADSASGVYDLLLVLMNIITPRLCRFAVF